MLRLDFFGLGGKSARKHARHMRQTNGFTRERCAGAEHKRYKLFVITLASGGLVVLWGWVEAVILLWLILNGCRTYISKSYIQGIKQHSYPRI